MANLKDLIEQAAIACETANVPNDAEPLGALHKWVMANCKLRPGTVFYVVTLLSCELADRSARREGFKDQADRAASRVNWRKQTNPAR